MVIDLEIEQKEKERKAKEAAEAKARWEAEMKLMRANTPYYPINVWRTLKWIHRSLKRYIKQGNIAKIKMANKLIQSLEKQAVFPYY